MNLAHQKLSGKHGAYVCAAILLTITLLTKFSKELFVEPSGHIEVFGNFGFVLVIGLLFKWKYAREVVSVLTFLAMLGVGLTLFFVQSHTLSFLVLFVGLAISFYLATFSKSVLHYLNNADA